MSKAVHPLLLRHDFNRRAIRHCIPQRLDLLIRHRNAAVGPVARHASNRPFIRLAVDEDQPAGAAALLAGKSRVLRSRIGDVEREVVGAVGIAVVDHKATLGRALVALKALRPDRRVSQLNMFDYTDRPIHPVERQGSRRLGNEDMIDLWKNERRRGRGRAGEEEQREDRSRARWAERELHRCARLEQCPLRRDFVPVAARNLTNLTGSRRRKKWRDPDGARRRRAARGGVRDLGCAAEVMPAVMPERPDVGNGLPLFG